MGYARAGFEVVGVDAAAMPRYPFEFVQGDALTFPLDGFDAVHASPPCQDYSTTRSLHAVDYPRLIAPVRERLIEAGVPFVIENVAGARHDLRSPVTLCGSSFGLGVRRHRLFETSFPVMFPPPCRHDLQREPVDVTGTGGSRIGERLDGGGGNSRKPRNLAHAREAMGIRWMTRVELAEAVPPAMTEWLGLQLLASMRSEAVA
jgi:DNA (cytosine-5)-methyltransferase 1